MTILDTGPLVAFVDRRERHHDWARQRLGSIPPPFACCESVLAEACFLLKTLAPLELVVRGLLVLSFTLQAEVVAVTALMEKYADVPMSLADACLVRMVEMGLGSKVLTLDSDFRIYRQGNRRVIPVDMPDDL